MRRERLRAHAKNFLLRGIGIAHHAAEKNRRRARHIRHALREAAARAGFRGRNSLAAPGERFHHGLFQVAAVARDDAFSQGGEDDFFGGLQNIHWPDAANIDFTGARTVTQFQAGDGKELFAHQILHI